MDLASESLLKSSAVEVSTNAMFAKTVPPDLAVDATDTARAVALFRNDGTPTPLRVKDGVVSCSTTGVPICEADFMGKGGGEKWKCRSRSLVQSPAVK